MVQIIQENKKPSLGQKFSNAVGSGLQGVNQILAQRQANAAAKQLFGSDLSGFDPETTKALLVEKLKQQGKDQRLGQTQEYVNGLFGSNSQMPQNNFGDQLRMDQSGSNEYGKNPNFDQEQSPNEYELPKNFDISKISDEDIARASILDPNLGRALNHAKDVKLREDREERKINIDEKNRSRKEEIEFHKETQKYDEELIDKTRKAKSQLGALNDIEKALNSGNVKPNSWTNIFRNFGDIGKNFANAIMNEDEATILSSIPQLLEGWKQVFGIRLSDADLKVLQDKLPDIGKSDEANRAILNVMKKYGKMTILRSEIGADLKKNNKGLRPLGYADLIEERFDDMSKSVRVINPNTGNVIEIPAYEVSNAIKAGARLANE